MDASNPATVFKNSCRAKNLEVANPVDFWKIQKKSVKFAKIRPNHVWCVKWINLLKNQNSAAFADNSAEFTDNLVIFEKQFCPIKKIWVNLKFNRLNDVVFENIFTSLLIIHSSFFYIFFFKYFEFINSKITDFEIWWGPNPSNFSKIHRIC
jgi:hypothetical protein